MPPSTLKDRLSGWVIHGIKPGPTPYLDQKEEKKLADYLVLTAKVGFGKTRKQVKGIVATVAKEKSFPVSCVSDGWWR